MVEKKTSVKKKETNKPSDSKNPPENFLIVGVGASAGGLESFKEFFTAMPDNPGMAFILVQHLDPTHKSLLTELIGNITQMSVWEVKDGTKVKPNNIYVIPPNKGLGIMDGSLFLLDPQEERGSRRPIDFFLRSLAEDQKERAIGIILSGTGSEGAIGLKIIKGEGGLTIAQEPKNAKYDGMPRNAIAAGVVDLVLPANKIPEQLVNYMHNRMVKSMAINAEIKVPKNLLDKVFFLIRNETGCNFSDYKSNTVIRRIEKRMAINQVENLNDYVKFLQKSQEEVLNLFKELLIGVTNFFRDKEAFDQLVEKGIPHIIKNKNSGETIRIWLPGCSTGEEAYTLAILFDEAINAQKKNLKVQIFASDINDDAISIARLGMYPESIVQDISSERLSRYFHAENHVFRIKKELRDMIVFAVQNVIKDPPFSKLDMVSCRNLLIYLNAQAQQKVFAIFHYSLNPQGILFLGNSESLGESSSLFTTMDRKQKIFLKKNVQLDKKYALDFSLNDRMIHQSTLAVSAPPKLRKESLEGITERLLLAKFAPACAIINMRGEAVYFSGDTGKYLQPAAGEARLNIVDMAREGLKNDLRTSIAKARKSKKLVERKNVKVKVNDVFKVIDLDVVPITQFAPEEEYMMITFEDRPSVEAKTVQSATDSEDASEVFALEQELISTKEYLRSTIEELEVSNEELKSTNEELQSANEELQSSNEELETSKEELQSINEEMVTVNTELQAKIDELAHAYNDLNNLLGSTDIGTIFLDQKLKVRRFTPSVIKVINLIQSDVGRPVGDLSSNLKQEDLTKEAKQVLDTLIPIKSSVQSKDGNAWFQMEIVPYRTSENVIDGVVLTFVDITDEKQAQEGLNKSRELYEELLKHTKTTIFKQDKNLTYIDIVSPHPDFKRENVIGKSDKELLDKKEEVELLDKMKKKVIKTGESSRKEVITTVGGQSVYYDLMVRPLFNDENQIAGVACTATDITELKQAQNKLDKVKD